MQTHDNTMRIFIGWDRFTSLMKAGLIIKDEEVIVYHSEVSELPLVNPASFHAEDEIDGKTYTSIGFIYETFQDEDDSIYPWQSKIQYLLAPSYSLIEINIKPTL